MARRNIASERLTDPATERVRRFYDKAAAQYDSWMRPFERVFLGDGRQRLCGRAVGRTLELAVGTGLNIPCYPPNVQHTGVDVRPAMLAIAERRAHVLDHAVELRRGDAQELDLPSSSFDPVLATLSLCTPSLCNGAAAEANRVLRSGGHLLLLEHVRSPVGPVRWAQRLLDPLARLSGDNLLREPLERLAAAGFRVEHRARSKWGIIEELDGRKSLENAAGRKRPVGRSGHRPAQAWQAEATSYRPFRVKWHLWTCAVSALATSSSTRSTASQEGGRRVGQSVVDVAPVLAALHKTALSEKGELSARVAPAQA